MRPRSHHTPTPQTAKGGELIAQRTATDARPILPAVFPPPYGTPRWRSAGAVPGLETSRLPTANPGVPTPPEPLRGVPRAIVRALHPSDALRAALAVLKPDHGVGALLAFDGLQSYFDAAKRQQRRIERARAALLKRTVGRTRPLFDEVHFYLICWARIAKLGRFIAHETRFARASRVLRRYHGGLTERIRARDHLEHFEERLPGGRRHHLLAIPGDLLNLHGEFLSFGGQRVDIGPRSIRLLAAMVNEFRTAVLFDSIEALAAADLRRLDGLLRQAGSDVQIARVMRKVRSLVTKP
jgi:hypothetical protein